MYVCMCLLRIVSLRTLLNIHNVYRNCKDFFRFFAIKPVCQALFVANLQNGEDYGQNRGGSVIEIDWILPEPGLHVSVQDEHGTENVPAEGENEEHATDVLAGLCTVALDYLGCQVDGEEESPEDAGYPANGLINHNTINIAKH